MESENQQQWLNRLKQKKVIAALLFLLAFSYAIYHVCDIAIKRGPPSPSKEITHLLGPVDDDGYIDYLAGLNELRATGISSGENAVVGLLELFDPNSDRLEIHPETFDALSIEQNENGEFLELFRWAVDDEVQRRIASGTVERYDEYALSQELSSVASQPWGPEQQWAQDWLLPMKTSRSILFLVHRVIAIFVSLQQVIEFIDQVDQVFFAQFLQVHHPLNPAVGWNHMAIRTMRWFNHDHVSAGCSFVTCHAGRSQNSIRKRRQLLTGAK